MGGGPPGGDPPRPLGVAPTSAAGAPAVYRVSVMLLACALLPPASADSPAPAVDMTASVQVLGNVPVEEVQALVMAKRAEILACNPSVAGFIGYAVLPAAAAPPFVEWKASSFVEPDIPHCVRDVLRRVGWPVRPGTG